MLVLTRNIGQDLIIGNDVTVRILGVSGFQVKIGIDAPKNVRVDRSEIRDRINAENNIDSDNKGNC